MTREINPLDEVEMVAYMKHLYEIEQAGERVPVFLGPYTAINMIGLLQLGLRHPKIAPTQVEMIGHLIDQLRPFFTDTPGEAIILMGDNPEFDQ